MVDSRTYKEQKAEKEEEMKKVAEAFMKESKKKNTCKECGYYPLRNKTRKNWPFGRKSKPNITKVIHCKGCGKDIQK